MKEHPNDALAFAALQGSSRRRTANFFAAFTGNHRIEEKKYLPKRKTFEKVYRKAEKIHRSDRRLGANQDIL